MLLKFDQMDAHLEYLFRTECMLRPRSTRLFKVASDGLAYESRSLGVRPGSQYAVILTGGSVVASEYAREVKVQCTGTSGLFFDLPNALTSEWEEALEKLGLGQARAIEVWPAGLAPVVWDGEGHGEWPASERPCLGIRVDHPVAELSVSMTEALGSPLDLQSVEPGKPVFVELPRLAVGNHWLRVTSRAEGGTAAESIGYLDVDVRIRASESRSADGSVGRSDRATFAVPWINCGMGALKSPFRGPLGER